MKTAQPKRHRVLIVDDNQAIHDDLRKILAAPSGLEDEMNEAEELLFGVRQAATCGFRIDSAHQGQEGLELLRRAAEEGERYTMAFVDVRMPPGWDGIETTIRLWECDPDLQVVICTAYTDYSWPQIVAKLGESHNFVILKKPFDNIEVVQLAHALGSKRDATEAARARLREVEAEVRQRRQTERELLAALDAAEEANRCKRDFLAAMSHELRTPLNAVLGYTEMLEEDARKLGAENMIPLLENVQVAGKHLLDLINDVLDMSRIESGRISIQPRRIPVRRIAEQVIGMVAPLAEKNRNRIELALEEEEIVIDVDEGRFRQSLLNLLGNACKFTSGGSITLEVRRQQAQEREFVEWRVRDTGIGIAEEHLDRLFKPFAQADSAITRRYGGSGLGLAISRRLCEMMGGAITVESRLGEGSVFTIRIPSCGKEPAPASMPAAPCPAAQGGNAREERNAGTPS